MALKTNHVFLLLCRAQRDFLNNKLEEVEGKLKEARAQKHENERERKMKAALKHMKTNIPGASCMPLC